jgi:rhomboid-like protein
VLPQWLGIRTLITNPGVTTHYVDLPPQYTDEDGLPFGRRDLTASEVVDIFGPHISTTAANKLLRILHGRRVAGTLEDPTLQITTMVFAPVHQKTALNYLRSSVPVDEIANAGLRAEDELAALEKGEAWSPGHTSSGTGTKSRFKVYQDGDADAAPKKDSVYGKSALDEIRARNKAKWEAALKQREEEKKKREEEERHGKAGLLELAGKHQPRQLSVKMQEYMANAQSDLKEPPKMPKWQRILPSAVFVLGVTGLCLAYAEFYQPAKRENRLWPEIPPAAATVGTLILGNLLIWGLWRVPPLWGLLNRNFMLVAATPRVVTMVNAMFSHQSFLHLLQNMAVLWFFGVRFHDEVGRGTFLATYFASGAVGALGTLTWAVLRNRLDVASLGASGAVYGIGAAYLWLHRFEHFRILGLPQPPSEGIQGLTFLALAAAMNIGGMFTSARLTMDITSHLVGMGVGIGAAHLMEKKQGVRRPQQKEGIQKLEDLPKTPLATKG